MTRRVPGMLLGAVLPGVVLCGCSSPQEDYCAAIEDHQDQLVEIAGDAGPGAVFEALPAYRDLREEAPPDLRDEWTLVVDRLATLDEAFEVADLDPADYDPKDPPADLSGSDREEIEAAARALGAAETREAMAGIEQQARDVCQTELGGEPAALPAALPAASGTD